MFHLLLHHNYLTAPKCPQSPQQHTLPPNSHPTTPNIPPGGVNDDDNHHVDDDNDNGDC